MSQKTLPFTGELVKKTKRQPLIWSQLNGFISNLPLKETGWFFIAKLLFKKFVFVISWHYHLLDNDSIERIPY
jgi:hypothetical protein